MADEPYIIYNPAKDLYWFAMEPGVDSLWIEDPSVASRIHESNEKIIMDFDGDDEFTGCVFVEVTDDGEPDFTSTLTVEGPY